MEFKKYQHIERIGSDEIDGLLVGECYVFPKIDGTNGCVWWDDNGVHAGSRNRELTLQEDNAGFLAWLIRDDGQPLRDLAERNPGKIVYGEWLVPHTLKVYRDTAWRQFYIFDVYDVENERYISYDEYKVVCEHAIDGGLPYIPLLEKVTNPTEKHLQMLVRRNRYLLQDGADCGEGIVIKRYDFENAWGHTVWGKIVRNEFKEENAKVFGAPSVVMQPLEAKIIATFVTPGRIAKIKAKMREAGPLGSRRIPELLGIAWHDLITEEMWAILKKHKRAVIDFGKLNQFCVKRVKELTPELFGGGENDR